MVCRTRRACNNGDPPKIWGSPRSAWEMQVALDKKRQQRALEVSRKIFDSLDGWIRMRGRTFIEGKKSARQNYRLPNAVLREKGLVFLLTDVL